MKNNEIFERELDGNVLRFQVIIPTTRQLTVQVLDVTPQYQRIGNLSEVAFPDDAVAVMKDGEYVTTEIGDRWISRFTREIKNRISLRNKALDWILARDTIEKEVATFIVDEIDKNLNFFEVKYLPVVVRWASLAEFDVGDDFDFKRLKEVLSAHLTCVMNRVIGRKKADYTVKFEDQTFKQVHDDGTVINLEEFWEVIDALRPWSKTEARFQKYADEGENMDVMEALRLMTKGYMRECGISLGYRTMLYTAGECWMIEKLKAGCNNSLTEEQVNGSFMNLMPLVCEDFDPDYYRQWDIGWGITDEDLKKMCLEAVERDEFDEDTLRALCWGIRQDPITCDRLSDAFWKND